MGEVAKLYGTFQTILSGNRTKEEQLVLYNSQSNRPAAYPGCSQHQYGFAADVTWAPMMTVTSKGRLFAYGREFTDKTMNNAARHVGLTLVAGDTGHFQAYNGIAFRNWAVSTGRCPLTPPPPQKTNASLYADCIGRNTAAFGTRLNALQTSACYKAFAASALMDSAQAHGFRITGSLR